MAKYEVIIPWTGVEKGQVIEIDNLSHFIRANVRPFNAVVESEDSADLKKEITALKTKLTKSENSLTAKDAEIEALKAEIEALKKEEVK